MRLRFAPASKDFHEPRSRRSPRNAPYNGTVTIDERIEQLTERHEALAQTVELITVDIRDLKDIASKSLDSVNSLLRIVESHERRLTYLEGTQ